MSTHLPSQPQRRLPVTLARKPGRCLKMTAEMKKATRISAASERLFARKTEAVSWSSPRLARSWVVSLPREMSKAIAPADRTSARTNMATTPSARATTGRHQRQRGVRQNDA